TTATGMLSAESLPAGMAMTPRAEAPGAATAVPTLTVCALARPTDTAQRRETANRDVVMAGTLVLVGLVASEESEAEQLVRRAQHRPPGQQHRNHVQQRQ